NADFAVLGGITPLMAAAKAGDSPAIRSLLRHGVDANVWGRSGTARDLASTEDAFHLISAYILGLRWEDEQERSNGQLHTRRLKEMAEKNNDPNAQYYLAQDYSRGRGVDRDPNQAMRWYRKSADQGHAVAQHCVGFLYSSGEGVDQN